MVVGAALASSFLPRRPPILKFVALNKIIKGSENFIQEHHSGSPGFLRADVRLGSKAVIPD